MKCKYCGKVFKTTKDERLSFVNLGYYTPAYYSTIEKISPETIKACGMDPNDWENMLCPDCVDKIRNYQNDNDIYDGKPVIRIGSSRMIFSRLILQKFISYVKTPNKFPATAYIQVVERNGGEVTDFGYNDIPGAKHDLYMKFKKSDDPEDRFRILMIKDSIGTWKCAYGNDITEGTGSVDFENKIF